MSMTDVSLINENIANGFTRYVRRFRYAVEQHEEFVGITAELHTWLEDWSNAVSSSPPTFQDEITDFPRAERTTAVESLRRSLKQLTHMVERIEGKTRRGILESIGNTMAQAGTRADAVVQRVMFDPPGAIREGGPRHDNDHEDIRDISIVPTHDELMCPDDPYLPANFPLAPHHLPADSMERIIDTQFRLLREELM